MDIMTVLWKIPERIAIALAGIGVLSGTFLPGVAEAVYKKAPEEYRDVPVTVINSGPTLLFSDSPETVYGTGILYKDVISGEGRVFFHHVNGTKERLKLAIMVRPVDKITYVTWGCRGIGEPNKDFLRQPGKASSVILRNTRRIGKKLISKRRRKRQRKI